VEPESKFRWWGDGLSEPPGYKRPKLFTAAKGPERRVQQMTQNLLRRIPG